MKLRSTSRCVIGAITIAGLAASAPTAMGAPFQGDLNGAESATFAGAESTNSVSASSASTNSARATPQEIQRAKAAAGQTSGDAQVQAIESSSTLWEGQTLQLGESLYSDNYQHKVELDDDGVLRKYYLKWWFLWVEDWSVDVPKTKSLEMRSSGNLELISASGKVLWQSNTANKPRRARASAFLQDDGNFVVRHGKEIVWDSAGTVIPDEPEEPETPETTNKLKVGDRLSKGDKLTSTNGKFTFTFQKDGNLVTTKVKSGKVQWQSGTAGRKKANRLVIQKDGNVVLYSKKNKAFWSTQTVADSPRNPRFVLKNNGELVVKHGKKVVWSSKNAPVVHGHKLKAGVTMSKGDKMVSKNKKFEFIFQKDGNLVTYNVKKKKAVWNSQTAGEDKAHLLTLHVDGALVLEDKKGNLLWESESDFASGDHELFLKLTKKGKLKIKDGKDTLWKSH